MVTDREELKRRVRERLGKVKPERPPRGVPWVSVALALAVVVITAVIVVWLRPWEGPVETVRFDYRMSFTYFGSENNVPLENLVLKWSAPKVENSLPEVIGGGLTWELYYIEDDNTLTLQTTENEVVNLRGNRSSQLEMYAFGYEESEYGPVYVAWFDRFYPHEVFIRAGYEILDKEMANKLTLKVYGQTVPIAGWYAVRQENLRIDFSLWVGAWRENVLVEQFVEIRENDLYGWYWLDPVS